MGFYFLLRQMGEMNEKLANYPIYFYGMAASLPEKEVESYFYFRKMVTFQNFLSPLLGQTFYDFTSTRNVKGSTRCVEVLRSTFYKFLPSTHRVEVPRSQTFKSQNEENLEPIWRRSAIVAPNSPHFGQKMQKIAILP